VADPGVRQPKAASLSRRQGLLEGFCIASGAVISSGLLVLLELVHARAGPAVVLSHLIVGLLAMTGALSLVELTTGMPRPGGGYSLFAGGPEVGAASIASVLILAGNAIAEPPRLGNQVCERLRSRIETGAELGAIEVSDELIHASVMLPTFYERRGYCPAWLDDRGPSSQADSLLVALGDADREGLRPLDYHTAQIETTLATVRAHMDRQDLPDPGRVTDLELLLTDAFLVYGAHLVAGRVDPERLDAEWRAQRREADLVLLLESALDSTGVRSSLLGLLPADPGYPALRAAPLRYRAAAAADTCPLVPDGPKMERGDRGERVRALRNRLVPLGQLLRGVEGEPDTFDEGLEAAVKQFQQQHGLDVDGVVGRATLGELNVRQVLRVRQIEVNMERWRWLPQDLGPRHVVINIADFSLAAVESGQTVLSMKVVVGKPYRRTPVFSELMTYLVLNPSWEVPPTIAIEDVVPSLRKDPEYLAKQEMRLLEGWGADERELDPKAIDWSHVTRGNLHYRFRQRPGPGNPLGKIKFMFPNRFHVYLHDTPSRQLFARADRSFSSGCIRVERAVDRAEYVLRGDRRWTRLRLTRALAGGVEQTVLLPEPIPLHLLYWTAWVDDQGVVQFRRDVYGRDKLLDAALLEPPPIAQ
jgi:murein L,D-transpeptidase YcbB/YkuD